MRNACGITSLAMFLAGLALAVIAGMVFQDADSQAIRNAWNITSLLLFAVAVIFFILALLFWVIGRIEK